MAMNEIFTAAGITGNEPREQTVSKMKSKQ